MQQATKQQGRRQAGSAEQGESATGVGERLTRAGRAPNCMPREAMQSGQTDEREEQREEQAAGRQVRELRALASAARRGANPRGRLRR